MTTKENERPQPGDRVRINNPKSCLHDKEYTIVERPEGAVSSEEKSVYAIDYDDSDDTVGSIVIQDCVIIGHGDRVSNDVDAALDKERDDNLRHIFGF